jgi:hypothetical protein
MLIGTALLCAAAGPAAAQVAIEIAPEDQTEIRDYVVREGRSSVRIDDDIVVGATLPETVEVYAIEGVPRAKRYRYAVVNDRRVLVDPESRRIIEIVR